MIQITLSQVIKYQAMLLQGTLQLMMLQWIIIQMELPDITEC